MRIRLVSNKKTLDSFECDEEKAKPIARQKALSAMVGKIPSITITFQKYNSLIQDWIDFGEIRGCL